jgi:hypothetical protein
MASFTENPPFYEGFILFAVIVWAFEFYLDTRQRKMLYVKKVPEALSKFVTQVRLAHLTHLESGFWHDLPYRIYCLKKIYVMEWKL